jgi:hypothetical protein
MYNISKDLNIFENLKTFVLVQNIENFAEVEAYGK